MGADFQSSRRRVHLAQHGAFAEEQWLLCIDDDVVEVTNPVSIWLIHNVVHDFVCVIVV